MSPGELIELERCIDELRVHTHETGLIVIDRWLANSRTRDQGSVPLRSRHRLMTNTPWPVAALPSRRLAE